MTTPTFCIIGAQKAGSSFLQTVLQSHPEIFVVRGEVPYFEDPDFSRGSWDNFAQLFDRATGFRAIGFKRPDYLAKPICAMRLRESLPGLKLIAILRDPVSRAVSAYFHYVRHGLLPWFELDDAMKRILNGTLARQFPIADTVISYGLYSRAIEQYRGLFPAEQLLIILNEDIGDDYDGTARRVYDFLGVASHLNSQPKQALVNEGIYNGVRLVLARIASAARYDVVASSTRLQARKIRLLRTAMYGTLRGLDEYVLRHLVGNSRPRLSPEIEIQLYDRFDTDVDRLEYLLGRDLSAWRRQRFVTHPSRAAPPAPCAR